MLCAYVHDDIFKYEYFGGIGLCSLTHRMRLILRLSNRLRQLGQKEAGRQAE
jgi:hypothetical protein